jgi:hypothetical protein
MSNFKQSKDYAMVGRKVWVKGDDTCDNPLMEIHAPYERVLAQDSYLLSFVSPLDRQFLTMKQRTRWLTFPTYKAAQQYARGLV